MAECSICVEKFNKVSHLKCACPHCQFESCRKCIQSYILTVEEYTISCMSCKKHWTIDTVDNFITKSFRNNELKEHREKILLDRERSLLPATQPEVQRAIKINDCKSLLKTYKEEHRILSRKIDTINAELYHIYMRTEKKTPAPILTIHCPLRSCNGFVENVSWKCGLCNNKVCKNCHEPITDEEHECKESDLETAKMIKKDSKPCPGCSVLIFKVSGCNQMWCTQCHTTFSWTSGEIIKGRVHNPHFYEWMRHNNDEPVQRELGDVPCGGIIALHRLRKLILPLKEDEIRFVFHIHNVLVDIQDDKLPYYRTDAVSNNTDLRIQFLMNTITEDKFKSTLQQREKKVVRYREIYDVLEMFLFTCIDMINNLTTDVVKMFPTFQKEVIELRNFGNTQFYKINRRYSCVVPILSTGCD